MVDHGAKVGAEFGVGDVVETPGILLSKRAFKASHVPVPKQAVQGVQGGFSAAAQEELDRELVPGALAGDPYIKRLFAPLELDGGAGKGLVVGEGDDHGLVADLSHLAGLGVDEVHSDGGIGAGTLGNAGDDLACVIPFHAGGFGNPAQFGLFVGMVGEEGGVFGLVGLQKFAGVNVPA
jgi:hypothetical protein